MIGAALRCRGAGHAAKPGTFATVTGFGSESYAYDAYGNLTANGATTLTTDPATNHLDAAVTGAAYDGAGNLTSLGFAPSKTTFTYDRFNQLASVVGPGINRSQATTADGERLFVRDGPTYLFTLRDLGGNVVREFEYTAAGGWGWKRDNVYRGGVLLASEARGEGIKHYHLDHLGSPRLVTNRTGEQLRVFATSPFGKDPTATQSSERMRFTVHERDVGQLTDSLDDIDYMHARSYSPRLGRFFSIDPVRGSPKRPQSLNLRAYVRGNPVGSLDPSGELVYIVTYTTGNSRADEELRRAAETRAQEIMKANKAFWDDRYDKVLVVGVSSKAEFADALKQARALEAQFGKVASLDMYSHASLADGPTFPSGEKHFSKEELSGMAVNWASGATATFHGCNTGKRFSAAFASAQGVTTYGNPRFAYFSGSPTERTPIAPRGPVYLPSVPGRYNPGIFLTDWVRWALGNTWADPMTRSEP